MRFCRITLYDLEALEAGVAQQGVNAVDSSLNRGGGLAKARAPSVENDRFRGKTKEGVASILPRLMAMVAGKLKAKRQEICFKHMSNRFCQA